LYLIPNLRGPAPLLVDFVLLRDVRVLCGESVSSRELLFDHSAQRTLELLGLPVLAAPFWGGPHPLL